MDAERFDALARALSTGASRRRLLQALPGLVLGGAIPWSVASRALDAGNEPVGQPVEGATPCTGGADCAPGEICVDGFCQLPGGGRAPTPTAVAPAGGLPPVATAPGEIAVPAPTATAKADAVGAGNDAAPAAPTPTGSAAPADGIGGGGRTGGASQGTTPTAAPGDASEDPGGDAPADAIEVPTATAVAGDTAGTDPEPTARAINAPDARGDLTPAPIPTSTVVADPDGLGGQAGDATATPTGTVDPDDGDDETGDPTPTPTSTPAPTATGSPDEPGGSSVDATPTSTPVICVTPPPIEIARDQALAAQIHEGVCGGLDDDAAFSLIDLGDGGVGTGTPVAANGASGAESAIPARLSTSILNVTIAELLESPSAVDIRLTADDAATSIACGDVGSLDPDAGQVAIGLVSQNDSGFAGIAYLQEQGERTVVTVFLAPGLSGGTTRAPGFAAPARTTPAPVARPAFGAGAGATLTEATDLRAAPGGDASVLSRLAAGASLTVTAAPVDGWVPVRDRESDLPGYVEAKYLAPDA